MKKSILSLLLVLMTVSTVLCQGDLKSTMATYISANYLQTADGDFVNVVFQTNDEKNIEFTEEAGAFYGDKRKDAAFTLKSSGGNNITNKFNIGKLYVLTYSVNGFGNNIIQDFKQYSFFPQKKEQLDSLMTVQNKKQTTLSAKNKCPNCAEEGAKAFIKSAIPTYTKEAEQFLKQYLEEALKENKYITYYFNNNRAAVIIEKKVKGRNMIVQVKKVNNKWVGLGIDDSFSSYKKMKKEDEVWERDKIGCEYYLDSILKKK